jgi:hypothetical protein
MSRPAAPDLSAALPDRPITVRAPATVGPASTLALFVLLFGLLAGALWWLGPDLLQDWRIGGHLVEARSARIVEAGCRSRVLVFASCNIKMAEGDAGAPTRTMAYFFIGSASPEPIALLQQSSALDAAAITTNLGQEKFYHRLLALVVIVAFLAFCINVSIEVYRKGIVTQRGFAALSGQRLALVVVTLEGGIPVASKRRRWTYSYDDGGRRERAFVEFASSTKPLFMMSDRKQALAVIGPGGGTPLLLDLRLGALDLTEAEKAVFFEACRATLDSDMTSRPTGR